MNLQSASLRLRGDARLRVLAHLLGLNPAERVSRFNAPQSDTSIRAYVARVDFARDLVLAIGPAEHPPLALAHLGIAGNSGELGFSVLAPWRGAGLATRLFEAVVAWAESNGLERVLCIEGHPAARRIVARLGLRKLQRFEPPRLTVLVSPAAPSPTTPRTRASPNPIPC